MRVPALVPPGGRHAQDSRQTVPSSSGRQPDLGILVLSFRAWLNELVKDIE